MDEKLKEILAKVLEERGLHRDAADFRDGDTAPVAMEAMRRAFVLGETSCRETRDSWCAGYVRMRDALRGLVDVLADNDQDGLTEFAPQMQVARAALEN